MFEEIGAMLDSLLGFVFTTYGIIALGCHIVFVYLRATSDEPGKWGDVAWMVGLTPVMFIIAPFMISSELRGRKKP